MTSIAMIARRRYEASVASEAAALFADREVSGGAFTHLHRQHDVVYGDTTRTGKDIRAMLHRMIVREARERPPEPARSPGFLSRAFNYLVDKVEQSSDRRLERARR